MKRQLYLTLIIVTFFSVCCSYGQDISHSSILLQSHHSLLNSIGHEVAFNNANYTARSEAYAYRTIFGGGEGAGYSKRRIYKDLKQSRNTAIAVTVLGAVFVVGGVALIANGAPHLKSDLNNGNDGDFTAHLYETYFGAGITGIGTGLSIGGIVTWVRAEKRLKKYLLNHPEEVH